MDTKQEFYEIDINLLPHKRRIRRTLDKQTRLILNIGIALVIIMAVIYAGLSYQIYTKNQYLNDLNVRISSLKSVEDTLNLRNKLGDDVFYYESTIEKLVNSQVDCNALISDIAISLPKETVVETLNVDTTKSTVQITGHTTDLQRLAWTVNALSANPNFSAVTVDNYNIPFQPVQNAPNYATFTISFNWKGLEK
ncbi:MAG: hypothetical protein KBI30_01965 [Candidatus Atribacteria bacterium]|nr:hypothetical protein [Candidatus Atribacteria bacterium]